MTLTPRESVWTTVDEQLATHATSTCTTARQVWKRGGVEPSGIEEMTRAARALKPEAVVRRGDPLFLHSYWEARVRAGVSGALNEATVSVSSNAPPGQRHPISVSLPLKCGATRVNFWLQSDPRHNRRVSCINAVNQC